MANCSCSTFAIGARQFVVQEAFDTIWCAFGSYLSLLTPSTSVMSGFFAGAVMITFFAPAARCLAALSRSVNRPLLERVDSHYACVLVAAKRARQINSYYHNLGEGTFDEYPPPMVETGSDRKSTRLNSSHIPLSRM